MAGYHVGCGAFGIYAGTLNKADKDGFKTWRSKSEVTEEAERAVVEYRTNRLKEMDCAHYSTIYKFRDGNRVRLTVEILGEGGDVCSE